MIAGPQPINRLLSLPHRFPSWISPGVTKTVRSTVTDILVVSQVGILRAALRDASADLKDSIAAFLSEAREQIEEGHFDAREAASRAPAGLRTLAAANGVDLIGPLAEIAASAVTVGRATYATIVWQQKSAILDFRLIDSLLEVLDDVDPD